MRTFDRFQARRVSAGLLLSLSGLSGSVLLGSGCSSSDSEVKADAGSGTGGAGISTGGQTGSTGGAGAASGGRTGTGGTTGTGGASGAGACAPRSKFTLAVHEILNVTWPAGTATAAGTGNVHLWGKRAFTANGNSLTGKLQACGSVLPPASLSALVGGGMLLVEIPSEVWDSPSATQFDVTASLTGWNVGDTLTYAYTALLGFTLADGATAPWPASYTGITMPTDPDGDMIPGITSRPRSGGGYVLPPTSVVGAIGLGARADKVYLVNRNVAMATQKWTSCEEGEGTSMFMHFNNHVIGCHVMGGSECTAAETKFVDDNRTIFTVTSAASKTKILPDSATCADVRTALPM